MRKKSIETLAKIQARCAYESLKATEGMEFQTFGLPDKELYELRTKLAAESLRDFAMCWFGEKHPETQASLDAQSKD